MTDKVIEIQKKLSDRINELPGDDGWWNSSGFETFSSVAAKLLGKGFSEDEAFDLLEECFWTVANEYGGS